MRLPTNSNLSHTSLRKQPKAQTRQPSAHKVLSGESSEWKEHWKYKENLLVRQTSKKKDDVGRYLGLQQTEKESEDCTCVFKKKKKAVLQHANFTLADEVVSKEQQQMHSLVSKHRIDFLVPLFSVNSSERTMYHNTLTRLRNGSTLNSTGLWEHNKKSADAWFYFSRKLFWLKWRVMRHRNYAQYAE